MSPSETAEDPLNKRYQSGTLILRLLKLAWNYRWQCLWILFLQIVLLVIGLSGLSLVGVGIDAIRHANNVEIAPAVWPFNWTPPAAWSGVQQVAAIAAGILLLALSRMGLNFVLVMQIQHLIQGRIVPTLRSELFEKLHALSFSFFDRNTSGSIINRVTGDVQAVRMFIDGVVMQAIIMVISLAVYLVYMFQISFWLTLLCLLPIPIMWVVSVAFSRSVHPLYLENRRLMDRLVLQLVQSIQGIATIKSFGRESHSRSDFAERNQAVLQQRFSIFKRVALFNPVIHSLTDVAVFLALLYGGYLVINGEIALGTGLVVFTGLLTQMASQLTNLSGLVDSAQQSLTAARRVFEVLDEPVSVRSAPGAEPLGKIRGEITFEKVNFKYRPTDSVLRELSFKVNPGEMIAIVGATGSGKSALLSLIPRFYDPNEGRMLLDGRDLRDLDLDDLRRHIGIVFQESFLFSNTIRANITFGRPEATSEEIERAARIACAHDFIMELEKGYDTILAETGNNLSGGQRQRLAIARAILWDPPILLLDDPTAAIDPDTEHEILEAMDRAVQGRTTFVVATRLSTLLRADRIFVLDHGRLVEEGTHTELMEREGLYRKAASLQMIDTSSMKQLRATYLEPGGET